MKARLDLLSAREKDVLRFLALEYTNKEIERPAGKTWSASPSKQDESPMPGTYYQRQASLGPQPVKVPQRKGNPRTFPYRDRTIPDNLPSCFSRCDS